jgi:hypothetical protein
LLTPGKMSSFGDLTRPAVFRFPRVATVPEPPHQRSLLVPVGRSRRRAVRANFSSRRCQIEPRRFQWPSTNWSTSAPARRGWKVCSNFPPTRSAWCCSPTAATAAGSARATLLLDLLTRDEDSVYENRFNIALLTESLGIAADWLRQYPATASRKLGLCGASTGAAAALQLAAKPAADIEAVVSPGGRPDLTGPGALHAVSGPRCCRR